MITCIVTIPIHKESPSDMEIFSFAQCCQVLGKHPICIVTHKGITIHRYEEIASKYGINLLRENFDASFFSSLAGYNLLMLDRSYYTRFSGYEYLLIYQLDAWVFRDELNYWCELEYDYIGAPWVKKDDAGKFLFDGVGNGGFSLRRVRHFINVLSYKGPVRIFPSQQAPLSLKNKIYKFLYNKGYQNTITYYKKDPTLFEDIFLSIFLSNTKLRAKIPDPLTAAHFAFEKEPSYLYSLTKKLPFGCHAWQKYEFNSFWKKILS